MIFIVIPIQSLIWDNNFILLQHVFSLETNFKFVKIMKTCQVSFTTQFSSNFKPQSTNKDTSLLTAPSFTQTNQSCSQILVVVHDGDAAHPGQRSRSRPRSAPERRGGCGQDSITITADGVGNRAVMKVFPLVTATALESVGHCWQSWSLSKWLWRQVHPGSSRYWYYRSVWV